MSSLPSKNQLLATAVKTYAKADIKVFWSCPICLIFLLWAKYLVTDCRRLQEIIDIVIISDNKWYSLAKALHICSIINNLFLHGRSLCNFENSSEFLGKLWAGSGYRTFISCVFSLWYSLNAFTFILVELWKLTEINCR